MMIKELVSILVPVYNIEKTIEKNINILIEKVSPFFMNFEIIISDDGSSDNSKEEIQKLCLNFQKNNTNKNLKNIIGVYARENQGKGHALKRACEMSSGEYIIFCDGDMEIDPSQLENFFVIMVSTANGARVGFLPVPHLRIHPLQTFQGLSLFPQSSGGFPWSLSCPRVTPPGYLSLSRVRQAPNVQ